MRLSFANPWISSVGGGTWRGGKRTIWVHSV